MASLDNKDFMLLELLKEDAAMPIRQIARKAGMPLATVHNRIKKLKNEGVIKKYTISIDHSKLGKGLMAYILMKTVPGSDTRELMRKITNRALVEICSIITGEHDLLIRLSAKDIAEVDDFVFNYLRDIKDVTQTQTIIVFENTDKI